MKCACICNNVLEPNAERVSRVIVWVVVPCATSVTCTGILAGLDTVVGVVAGVTVGVTETTGPCPLAGVPVALAVGVLVFVAEGVGVADAAVAGPLAGS